jgi:hypothetical protein
MKALQQQLKAAAESINHGDFGLDATLNRRRFGMFCTNRFSGFLVTLILAVIATGPLSARDKTDVIILANGDRVTGEIKKVDRGLLELKTDFMGTINIEWEHIKEVTSQYAFQVELTSGARYLGSIGPADDGKLGVTGAYSQIETDVIEVVKVTPIEDKFWDRVKASIDFGFSFKRANRVTDYNLAADASYRVEKYLTTVGFSSSLNSTQNTETTQRNVVNTQFQRFLANRWSVLALAQFTQNQELGLDFRALWGGGVGKSLVQTNNSIVTAIAAGLYNREKFIDEEAYQNSLEGLGGLTFQAFKFSDPEVDISSNLFAIPGITDWGRIRLEFEVRLRWEIFKDFYWSASAFDSFDSRPPEGTEKNDFGVSTSVGYKF